MNIYEVISIEKIEVDYIVRVLNSRKAASEELAPSVLHTCFRSLINITQ